MVKKIHLQCRRHGFSPWVRKIPWTGNGNSVQYSCLGNPKDRGACQAEVSGVARVGHNIVTTPPPLHHHVDKNMVLCNTTKLWKCIQMFLPKISKRSSLCLCLMPSVFSLHGSFCFQHLARSLTFKWSLPGYIEDHKGPVKSFCGPESPFQSWLQGHLLFQPWLPAAYIYFQSWSSSPESSVWSPWGEFLMSVWVVIFQIALYF